MSTKGGLGQVQWSGPLDESSNTGPKAETTAVTTAVTTAPQKPRKKKGGAKAPKSGNTPVTPAPQKTVKKATKNKKKRRK